MSSTSRGSIRSASDYYATPQWAIAEFLEAITTDAPSLFGDDLASHDLAILDPCAGGDRKNLMAYPSAIKKFKTWNPNIYTMDIRLDSRAKIKADYLKSDVSLNPDIIITNPPFSLALEITQKALRDVRDGGLVIMLQRLNWFGGQKRKAFWQENMPVACYIHSKRMAFSDASGTDSIEYAHFVWQKGQNPKFTQTKII